MKTLILTLTLVLLALSVASAQVWVNPYTTRGGTSVPGHYRSAPDRNPYNNYGFPGNYNPNTGRDTSGSQERYLEQYNAPKPYSPLSPYSTTPRTRGWGR